MNYETTNRILECLKPYTHIDSIYVSTENIEWKGRKYKSDFVKLDEKHNVGFEVFDCEIIVFYFTDHQHFYKDNDTTEETDNGYIDRAIEFLIKLFTLSIRHLEIYKGKKLHGEKYYFIQKGQEELIGCWWYGLVRLINPFARKWYKRMVWQYDAGAETFVHDAPIKPDESALRS